MNDDATVKSLRSALAHRREIEFKIGGAPVTMRPHILYLGSDGNLRLAGMVGDIPGARVLVSQIHDLIVSPRYFHRDPAFDFSDPEYENTVVSVADI